MLIIEIKQHSKTHTSRAGPGMQACMDGDSATGQHQETPSQAGVGIMEERAVEESSLTTWCENWSTYRTTEKVKAEVISGDAKLSYINHCRRLRVLYISQYAWKIRSTI